MQDFNGADGKKFRAFLQICVTKGCLASIYRKLKTSDFLETDHDPRLRSR
ncbi:hypothetical protein NBRC3257_0442 [Gluconobacter thailandicus NBRC 3257]|uniref:Transposase n=1 Tax=Gluconobacter thailandicus NBRC 3257 TaxID=1381097 RepID=A0ABQ0ITC5_GLUTH|nr:hypothetical protein B932_2058 [Gluconobacter oxydans H24]GAD25442.1 hypothetical protein NBRC3257_0442 [Gluconobacter thailandicus NBRC 3257]